MPERIAIKVRYIGEAAPNFDEAVSFYEDAWGLRKVEHDTDIAFFAAESNPEQYIFRLRRDSEKRLDVIGFGVETAGEVDALAAELAAAGVRFAGEPGALKTPGGGYGFRVFDPDGRVVEISSHVEARKTRPLENRESIPVGISHIVLSTPNVGETCDFYKSRIGFLQSDAIGEGMQFLTCDDEHHRIAVFQGSKQGLNHVAFEMRDTDEYMRATGRVMKFGGVLRWGPGRHLIGDNTFSYFFDPNGNVSELTSDMEKLRGRAPITIRPEDNGEIWGTAKRVSEDAVPQAFLMPETGHWMAPPV
jgi:catechol 2,3-dioxygenase-like lactoylglutathione lyase family enzyme